MASLSAPPTSDVPNVPESSSKQLFVGNLPPSFTREELCDVFRQFGVSPISSVIVKGGKHHGFVTFSNPEDAAKARADGNGHILVKSGKNYPLKVDIVREKPSVKSSASSVAQSSGGAAAAVKSSASSAVQLGGGAAAAVKSSVSSAVQLSEGAAAAVKSLDWSTVKSRKNVQSGGGAAAVTDKSSGWKHAQSGEDEAGTVQVTLFVRANDAHPDERFKNFRDLRRMFDEYGRVKKFFLLPSGNSAFVTFETGEDADKAKAGLSGTTVETQSMGKVFERQLYIGFVRERGIKQRASAPSPRSARAPAPRSAPAPAPAPAPARAPAPVRDPSPDLPIFDPSIVKDCNDSMFTDPSNALSMKWLGVRTCSTLLNIGQDPTPKVMYRDMQTLTLFSNGPLRWYIPHPNHPSALNECLDGIGTGRFTHMTIVQIPSEVLKISKCWRS